MPAQKGAGIHDSLNLTGLLCTFADHPHCADMSLDLPASYGDLSGLRKKETATSR